MSLSVLTHGAIEVSIVIINWNSKAYLRRCLDSVVEQTSNVRHEIVVADAGSFDGCAEMVRREFPDVRFLQLEKNHGFARSNNLAFQATSGEAVLFLNPDTELTNRASEVLLAGLTRLPAVGLLGARLLNTDRSLQTSCVQSFPTISNQLVDADILRNLWPRCGIWGNRALFEPGVEPSEVDAVSGACLLVSRHVFQALGGFSEDYFMYAEDIELAYRARRMGLKNYYVPAAEVIHHGGSSSGRAESRFATVMLREAMWRYFGRTRGRGYARAYRCGVCVSALVRLGMLGMARTAMHRDSRRSRLAPSWSKWKAALRWSTGRDDLVRQYYGE